MSNEYGEDWLPTNRFLTELKETAVVLYILAREKAPITTRIIESLDEIFVIDMNYPLKEMKLSFDERMSLVYNVAKDIESITIELLDEGNVKSEKSASYDEKIELYQTVTSLAYNRVIPLYRELMAILAPERNKAFESRRIDSSEIADFLENLRHGEDATLEEFKVHLKEDHTLRVLLKRYGIDPDTAEDYL
jgi:hypothetical protein